jgi:hypothetical protein
MKQLIPLGLVCLMISGCSAPSLPADVMREVAAAESRKEVVRLAGGSGTTHIIVTGSDIQPMIDALTKLISSRKDYDRGSADYIGGTWANVIMCDDWAVGFASPDKHGMTRVEIAAKGSAAYGRIIEFDFPVP